VAHCLIRSEFAEHSLGRDPTKPQHHETPTPGNMTAEREYLSMDSIQMNGFGFSLQSSFTKIPHFIFAQNPIFWFSFALRSYFRLLSLSHSNSTKKFPA
jgi:hypothetical protein